MNVILSCHVDDSLLEQQYETITGAHNNVLISFKIRRKINVTKLDYIPLYSSAVISRTFNAFFFLMGKGAHRGGNAEDL